MGNCKALPYDLENKVEIKYDDENLPEPTDYIEPSYL